jgi:hypothetical protein
VVLALKDKNMQALSMLVNPADGVRFSPYSFVREEDLFFGAAEVAMLMDSPSQYLWGTFDGSGEAINMTFADYYARFVYDVDFASAPQVSINEELGKGTAMNNAAEFYPGAMIVEYHFPGFDAQYQGMAPPVCEQALGAGIIHVGDMVRCSSMPSRDARREFWQRLTTSKPAQLCADLRPAPGLRGSTAQAGAGGACL